MSNEEIMRSKLAEIGARYLARTASEIGELDRLVAKLPVEGKTTLKEIELLAHRIRGSGAVFGFAKLSDAAGEIEMLAVHNAAVETPTAELIAQFSAHIRSLSAETQLATAAAKS